VGRYRELTRNEFLATMPGPVRSMGIDEPSPIPGISIKECVLEALPIMGSKASLDTGEIHHVYLTEDGEFAHVLVNFGEENVFLVVILDRSAREIRGYYRLNLRKEYGLE
jgi:hypothetical protein